MAHTCTLEKTEGILLYLNDIKPVNLKGVSALSTRVPALQKPLLEDEVTLQRFVIRALQYRVTLNSRVI